VRAILIRVKIQEGEEQDEDTWNVATAAGTCLALIATTVLDEVVPHVMPFVRDNISNTNWHFREAAVLAFGSFTFSEPRTVATKSLY
jgi:importin subunit beta-1